MNTSIQSSPNISLTVGLGGEREVADKALERSLSVVCAQVSDEGALVRAGVVAQVTFIRRQTHVCAGVAWNK